MGLIKHEKANYSNFLRKISGVDHKDEYSLHHEFSKKLSETDQMYIQQLVGYIFIDEIRLTQRTQQ